MSEFFIIGDVHNRIEQAQKFIDEYKPNKIIHLGDELDMWGDGPVDAEKTGLWMKKCILSRPQDIWLIGNHNLPYMFPKNEKYRGWGWTKEKASAFNSVFPKELWNKFKVFHIEMYRGQKVVFSHAGFKEHFLPNGGIKNLEDTIFFERTQKDVLRRGNNSDYNPWLDSPMGPMWQRWPLPILEGLCQCVGHTRVDMPTAIKTMRKSAEWNLNIDCFHSYVCHFAETGVYSINIKNSERILIEECTSESGVNNIF